MLCSDINNTSSNVLQWDIVMCTYYVYFNFRHYCSCNIGNPIGYLFLFDTTNGSCYGVHDKVLFISLMLFCIVRNDLFVCLCGIKSVK